MFFLHWQCPLLSIQLNDVKFLDLVHWWQWCIWAVCSSMECSIVYSVMQNYHLNTWQGLQLFVAEYLHQKSICSALSCPPQKGPLPVRHDECHKGCAMYQELLLCVVIVQMRWVLTQAPPPENCTANQRELQTHVEPLSCIDTLSELFSWIVYLTTGQYSKIWSGMSWWWSGDRLHMALIEYLWPLRSNRISAIHV